MADVAEEANHHPDILVHGWNKVRLSVTNHSAGGLTQADFDLAATIDRLPAIAAALIRCTQSLHERRPLSK